MLPGGFAIMYAAFCELDIESMRPAQGALREGVLYDLLGRFTHNDMREATVNQFMRRYHVDAKQVARVVKLSHQLAMQFFGTEEHEADMQLLAWVASLHGIGIRVAHSGYHKHTAYILANADMPGFSKKEQARMSLLALAHRGSMKKLQGVLTNEADIVLVMSLRLAALFYRNRSDIALPEIKCMFSGTKFYLKLGKGWLEQNPLTESALRDEAKQWKALGVNMQLSEL